MLKTYSVRSPNERDEASFWLDDDGPQRASLFWRVRIDGRELIEPSRMGLAPDGLPPWGANLEITAVVDKRVAVETWEPVYGEHASVAHRFEEFAVDVTETIPPRRTVRIWLRAFDGGAALRYERVDSSGEIWNLIDEQTAFQFPTGSIAYRQAWPEDTYHPTPVNALPDPTVCPLLIQLPSGGYAVVQEAGNRNSGRMMLDAESHRGILTARIQGVSPFEPGAVLPWRVVLHADEINDLVGVGSQIASLCPQNAIRNTDWIVPGKAIREVTLSTAGGIACVDFAAAHGMSHILYDAGWYGHEYDDHSDPRSVDPDPDRTDKIPGWAGLNLREVIDYSRERGIGVFVYVNRRHLERYLDDILPLYQGWGIAGIKFGFVNVGPAGWTSWLYDAVERCADHHLMVDIHDNHRPTGLSRTYPNLLTQEGVRGNEHFPDSSHNCLLPYTRFVAGAADYTICYRESRLQTTCAHQLAIAAAFYSPLQLVYWYAQPSRFDSRTMPELTWFDRVPTVWDDSVGIGGELGKWAAIARRSGDTWYVGVLNGATARSVTLSLEKLNGSSWKVERFDDATGHAVVAVTESAGSEITCDLQASGGSALILKAS